MRSSGSNSGSGSSGGGNRNPRGGSGGSFRSNSQGGGQGGRGQGGGGQGGRGQSGGQGGRGPAQGGQGGRGQGGRGLAQGGRGQGGRGPAQGDQGRAGRDDQQEQRPRRPRPEERRYDVGPSTSSSGAGDSEARKGRGASARGGAKGGPKAPLPGNARGGFRRGPSGQARPRELDAKIEQRNRDRYADKPDFKVVRTHPGAEQEGERLQKILARAGMGSRRACEELIEQSRVEVNGEIVLEQGKRVDPQKDEIKVDGLTVATQSYLFFALNKPAGVVSSMEDPDGRQCLGDYVTNRETRLFHVGQAGHRDRGHHHAHQPR